MDTGIAALNLANLQCYYPAAIDRAMNWIYGHKLREYETQPEPGNLSDTKP